MTRYDIFSLRYSFYTLYIHVHKYAWSWSMIGSKMVSLHKKLSSYIVWSCIFLDRCSFFLGTFILCKCFKTKLAAFASFLFWSTSFRHVAIFDPYHNWKKCWVPCRLWLRRSVECWVLCRLWWKAHMSCAFSSTPQVSCVAWQPLDIMTWRDLTLIDTYHTCESLFVFTCFRSWGV